MSSREELEGLLARVEQATEPDRAIDAGILAAIGYRATTDRGAGHELWVREPGEDMWFVGDEPPCSGSLDAIVGLIERELGWYWRAGRGSVGEWVNGRRLPGWCHLNRVNPNHCNPEDEATGWGATPELACCAAFLRARIAMESKQ